MYPKIVLHLKNVLGKGCVIKTFHETSSTNTQYYEMGYAKNFRKTTALLCYYFRIKLSNYKTG